MLITNPTSVFAVGADTVAYDIRVNNAYEQNWFRSIFLEFDVLITSLASFYDSFRLRLNSLLNSDARVTVAKNYRTKLVQKMHFAI